MIREFQKSDIDEIMKIWKKENIRTHNFIKKEYWENNYEYVKELLTNAEIYVYTLDKKVVGFIGLNDNYIEGIFINIEYQRRGIGSSLLNVAKKNRNKLELSVYKKNKCAIEFYKKNDFVVKNENIDISTNEIEYIMSWKNSNKL